MLRTPAILWQCRRCSAPSNITQISVKPRNLKARLLCLVNKRSFGSKVGEYRDAHSVKCVLETSCLQALNGPWEGKFPMGLSASY